MSFSLRDYQKELIIDIIKSMKAGNHKIMVQSPPRSGKTVVMSFIAKNATDKNKTVLFFSHRKEINEQVHETFKRGGVSLDNVIIGTVGSIVRRLNKLPEVDVILVDEAHHIKAKQYQTILNHFKNATQLFFTGTPIRLDGYGFHDLADDLVVGKSIRWLQEHGNISEFDYYSVNLLDMAKLKKRSGEFTNHSVDEALDFKTEYGDYIDHYERLAKGKQAIVYTHSVEYAERVSKRFSEHGYQSGVVSGKTPQSERESLMQAFRDGKLTIMVNVNLFTEGIDLPNVDVCIMLRPTASLSLYLQFAMRALNPRDGKRAILIDHVGNHIRHGLPNDDRDWTLDGAKKTKKASERSTVTCEECFATFWRDQLEDGHCPYCNAGVIKKKTIEDIEREKSDVQLEKINQGMEFITIQGEKIEVKKEEAIVYRRVMTYGKRYTRCKNLSELKAFRILNGYKPGWMWHKQKELNLWR